MAGTLPTFVVTPPVVVLVGASLCAVVVL